MGSIKHSNARFAIGQVVHHKIFDYRGIVIDVDPLFQQSQAWYELMAKTMTSRDSPWYHILVDGTDYRTYVAEQNLELDILGTPVKHPDVEKYFSEVDEGIYKIKRPSN